MSDAGGAPPPNWYPDPDGGGGLRWWDGTQWTEHRAPGQSTQQSWGQAGAAPSPAASVDPWLWQSIVATILCCLPAGVVGIVFASQAQTAIAAGDLVTARRKATLARNWTIAAVLLVLAWIPLFLLFLLPAFFTTGW